MPSCATLARVRSWRCHTERTSAGEIGGLFYEAAGSVTAPRILRSARGCGRMLGNPFRKIDNSASFEPRVPFLATAQKNFAMEIARSQLFESFALAALPTAARVGAFRV